MSDVKNSAFFSRFMLWVHERFPLANLPLFVVIYFLSMCVASLENKSISLKSIVVGSVLSISFFLLLRVLDEHKDYKDDCIHHPGRVLQRGVIRLAHLKIIGVICVILQLAGMYWLSPELEPLLISWGLLLFWTGLMTKEFFAPEWLKQRFFLYAFSHTLIMPFIIWWLATLTYPHVTLTLPLALLMFLSFISGLSFEITRKCKGPDEDRPEVTTYSQLYGRPLSVFFIILLLCAMALMQYLLILNGKGAVPGWFYSISGVLTLFTIGQLVRFLIASNKVNRKRNELMVGLAMMAGYLLCIVALYD